MASPDITSSEISRINEDLKKFLQVSLVKAKPVAAGSSKGLEVSVEEYCGEDLESGEFKEYCTNLAEELTDRVKDKFRQKVARVFIKNLDTGETQTIFNRVSSATIKVKAGVGESRDEVVEALIRARSSLLEAVDSLYDAKNLADRGVSKKVAQDLQEKVINVIDGENTSAVDELRELIKALSSTALIYEE